LHQAKATVKLIPSQILASNLDFNLTNNFEWGPWQFADFQAFVGTPRTFSNVIQRMFGLKSSQFEQTRALEPIIFSPRVREVKNPEFHQSQSQFEFFVFFQVLRQPLPLYSNF
jgi:hypothetical protein